MLSGVSGFTLNGEVRTVGPSLSLFSHLEFGLLRYEPLVSGSSCSLFGPWRNAWFDKDTCSASPGWLLEVFCDFLRDWVDSAPEVDSLVLTGDASVARLLSLEIWVLFLRASCGFSLICVEFFARVDFLGPSSTHSCECSRAGGAGVAGSFTPR